MEKTQLYMIRGRDYLNMTKDLLSRCGLAELIPDRETLIGIKPNLVSATDASFGATTHPEIVAGIIEYLKENGFHNLLILEGSWVGERTMDSVAACGYDALCGKYGVEFRDMQKDRGVRRSCAGMELSLCESVLKLGYLINVPVLKGHCQTKVTCALKNLKGLIPNSEKRRFHSLGLHKPIAHLNAGIRQDFIVVDNICGDLDFEDGGNPVQMDRIIAGRDPVLVDAWAASLLHYKPEEIPYIPLAQKLGVGSADLSAAEILTLGEERDDLVPERRKVVEVQDHVCEVDSCSACYAYLIPALQRLKEEGLLSGLTEKICIGQGFRGKTGSLGIGNCTAGFSVHLGGCPPLEDDIYNFLRDYIAGNCGRELPCGT